MKQDPWAQFAEAPEAPAPTSAPTPDPQTAADFAQFAPATPAGMPSQAYIRELQRRFDRGQTPEQLNAFVRGQGFDPAATDFAHALKLRARGNAVQFVDNGSVRVTPNDGSEGGLPHDAAVAAVGAAEGAADTAGMAITSPLTPVGQAIKPIVDVLHSLGMSPPSITDLVHSSLESLGFGTARSQGERLLKGGAAGFGAGLVSGGEGAVPVLMNLVGGTASGLTGEAAAEGGYGQGAQLAAGLVGGLLPSGLRRSVAGARNLLTSGERSAALADAVPHEVALDEAGNLTPEGHEAALRAGVPDEAAAEMFARRRRGGDRPADTQARREAVRNRDRSQDGPLPAAAAPTAEMPQQVPNLSDRTDAVAAEIERRLRTGEAFDAPNAPTPPPRDVFTEAGEERIPLTRGQAEQNFEVQNDENSLRVSATREGEQARQWFNQQQTTIQDAIGRLRSRFGPDAGNAADRGEQVQQAVRDLRDAGAEGVRTLYRQAEELGGEGLQLNTKGIHDAATDVLIDEAVPEQVKKAISQELARYGIIGTAEPTNEAGLTRITLDDGSGLTIRGPIKQLTASNAEDLRRAINRLYDPTKPNLTGQSIKPAIDQALEEGLTNAADGQGAIGNAYREARAAHQEQRRTFSASDIIQSLHANKKGTQTPVLLPERAIARVIGAGADGVTNLRTTKALLLSGGTDSARQAWRAIQHQGLADIFDSALARNVNHGHGQIGDLVSGAKLNSAIDRFGVDKLRILLSPEDFNGLMKLRRIIGAATIPISGTTNPSGTATKIINYLRQGTLRFAGAIPGVGHTVNAFAGLAAKGKEIAGTRRTLEGITSYRGPASSRDMDRRAQQFIRDYIDSGSSGALVPATINLSNRPEASQ